MRIAIDGPAGAGKSTIAKSVAERLGVPYLDTGAMYRAAGLKADRLGLDSGQTEELEAMLSDLEVEVKFEPEGQIVLLDGEDVTHLLRTPRISRWASDISALPACRYKMVELQRRIASRSDVVMDGRDIGTFVLPDAEVKIFLTASPEQRAERRLQDEQARGDQTSYDQVLQDLKQRDEQDSTRELAPLAKADDAVEIDTTDMSIAEVVSRVLNIVEEQT